MLEEQTAMPEETNIDYGLMIRTLTAWKGILNARLLALISLVGAVAIYSFAAYDPSSLRLWAAGLYSTGVLWPLIVLFLRKG